MDSGWDIVLGKGLCQSAESRCVHPCHQIQQMDQEGDEQWGSPRPPPRHVAPTPVLAAAAPDGPLISPLPSLCFASAERARSRADPGHVSIFNQSQGGDRAAPGGLAPALASWWGGTWWTTRPWVSRRGDVWPGEGSGFGDQNSRY